MRMGELVEQRQFMELWRQPMIASPRPFTLHAPLRRDLAADSDSQTRAA